MKNSTTVTERGWKEIDHVATEPHGCRRVAAGRLNYFWEQFQNFSLIEVI